jgi:MoaA/NifB/PqqE/SkfB family radical SAM enzyme
LFFGRLAIKEHLAPRLHVAPLVAELFVTENCNLKCLSCNCWRQTTRDELSTQEWFRVIDELGAAGIVKANFTGGEPLLRADTPLLMRRAVSAGVDELHLNTNAMLLDERRRMAVLEAGVRSFNISVDGATPTMHDRLRGLDGAFDTTVRHIEELMSLRDRFDLRVRLNFTVMRHNLHQVPDIARLASSLGAKLYLNLATDTTFLFRAPGVDELSAIEESEMRDAMRSISERARADPRSLPRYSDLRYVRRHFTERLQRELPCAESQLKLMIHSRGEIGGCWGEDPHDNVRNTSIAAVIASREYRDSHERYFRKDCVGCGSNYSLNLRCRPSTYWADLQWRLGRRDLEED